MKNVLLVCGSGASSAFMAMAIRKAAVQENYPITVFARSESEIENYADEIDAVMIGPHLSSTYQDIKEQYQDHFQVILMKPSYYATLNGAEALAHIKEVLGE